ncbi:hypothetical protein NOVO_05750 [Rickettsiales bacterium Ac37b]|nr:hypothetical protein NOVO_05750 [Rickettsiales bacterium Ac37b]
MGIIQDTFFNLNRHKYDRDNIDTKKKVKCEDSIYIITKDIPKNFRERDDILAEANLESSHLHHRQYGFLVKLQHYNLAFASPICPDGYQLIDMMPKNEVKELYLHFPEEIKCVPVCLGVSDTPIL